ncbi:MAG TPA: phosphomannose isomerase type II C-terminal cupin domain [Smithellaceae bacterium]|nr:phosphomannose isomerase type II C-terminal cupin domain [Smithellaceae bacterium]
MGLKYDTEKTKKEFCLMNSDGKRPWGYFEVLADEPDYKVKRIVVKPGGRLSMQSHQLRNEQWYVVQGEGRVVIDGRDYSAWAGASFHIPAKSVHRLENSASTDLVIIEIQTGSYFGEDDIERLADDYGRN